MSPRRAAGVALRRDVLQQIEALIPKASSSRRRATRSDVLRSLILAGLEVLERRSLENKASKRDPATHRKDESACLG